MITCVQIINNFKLYIIKMFFYLIYLILNKLPLTNKWRDSQKNILNFILGCILYVTLHSFINHFDYNNFVFGTIKQYIYIIAVIDIIAVGIIYKLSYNKSLFSELLWNNQNSEPIVETIECNTVNSDNEVENDNDIDDDFEYNEVNDEENIEDVEENIEDVEGKETDEILKSE